jgi:two-component system phosphate regulon sensor histidine kinase PhoR
VDAPAVTIEAREQLDWLRERVLNVVGHELRTPVTTIRGLADALAGTEDPVARSELLTALRRHAARLERLLDDLLGAAGVTTSLPVGPAAAIDVGATVRSAWVELGGAPGRLAVDADATAVVSARPQSVQRVLAAVLGNAVAYGDGVTTVGVERSGGAIVTVVDSPGPDLPDEDIRFATEAFWRGERAVTTVPGLGLGLAVARSLAEHERGRLDVVAKPGGGVRTTISLPAAGGESAAGGGL